jgi:hypothetical protein
MSKRPSRPYRDLQVRLLRALNEGFVPPAEHKTPFYRLRDGKAIRKASHLIVFQVMEDWDNRNGKAPQTTTYDVIGGPMPDGSYKVVFNPKVIQAAMLWAELTESERDFVVAFISLREGREGRKSNV